MQKAVAVNNHELSFFRGVSGNDVHLPFLDTTAIKGLLEPYMPVIA